MKSHMMTAMLNDCESVTVKFRGNLNDLDHLNMRLMRINLKYQKKGKLLMKSHMMTAMLNDYESVTVKFRGNLNDTSLIKFCKEIVLQYKSLV